MNDNPYPHCLNPEIWNRFEDAKARRLSGHLESEGPHCPCNALLEISAGMYEQQAAEMEAAERQRDKATAALDEMRRIATAAQAWNKAKEVEKRLGAERGYEPDKVLAYRCAVASVSDLERQLCEATAALAAPPTTEGTN